MAAENRCRSWPHGEPAELTMRINPLKTLNLHPGLSRDEAKFHAFQAAFYLYG
jgi:hypothetical protein